MAAFNFPNSPSTNDLHTENNVTWKWNGTVWKRQHNSYLTASTLNITGISTFGGYVYIPEYLIHQGDGNTWFRFPSDDTITLGTSGSTRVIIDSGGRIGIKNTSPSSQYFNNLVVGDNSSGDWGITIRTNSSNKGVIAFSDSDAADANRYDGYIAYHHNGQSMRFHTGGANERLRITSGGNVGVSTVTPAQKLHVFGNSGITAISLGDNGTTEPYVLLEANATDNTSTLHSRGTHPLTFKVNNSERLRIDSSGNVNIGVNASSNPFTYLRFGASQYGAADIRPTDETSHKVGLSFYTDGTQDTTINPTERLRIDSSGNVGVNNTNPAAYGKFVVTGTSNVISLNASSGAGSLSFFENGTGRFYLKTLNGSDGLSFVDADGSSERLRIDSSGRVLIGTTTEGLGTYGEELTIGSSDHAGITVRTGTGHKGTIYFSDGTSGAAEYKGSVQYDHSDDSLRFASSGAEKLRVTSAGKVGVDNTSPANKVSIYDVGYCGLELKSGRTTSTDNIGGLHWKNASNQDVAYMQSLVDGTIKFRNTTSLTERLRITSAGRVGIGMASPHVELDIFGDASSRIVLRTVDGSSTSNHANLSFCVGSGSAPSSGNTLGVIESNVTATGGSCTGDMRFYTNPGDALTERLRITSAGTAEFYGGEGATDAIKVQSEGGGAGLYFSNFQGITDTGDSTRLGVGKNDNALIWMNASGSQVGCLAYGTTDAVPLVFSTANTERLRIEANGHLTLGGGIIYGENNASNVLKLQSTSGNNNHSRIEIGAIQSSDNGGVHFYTAGTSVATRRMTLKGTSGYLGLGVDNPVSLIHTGAGNVGIARTINNHQTSNTGSIWDLSINRESFAYPGAGTAAGGLNKSLNVDNQYAVSTFRSTQQNYNGTAQWYDVALFNAWDFTGKVVIQSGGTFTGDEIVIDIVSSYNSALGNGRSGPYMEVRRTEGHNGGRFTKVRVGCHNSARSNVLVQVYYDGNATHNANSWITSTVFDYGSGYGCAQNRAYARWQAATTINETWKELDIDGSNQNYWNTSTTPAFMAYKYNNSGQISSGTYVYNAQVNERGGDNYSTSTGRFTAPCDGYYYVQANVQLYGSGTSGKHCHFKKNGSDIFSGGTSAPWYDEPAGNHHNIYMFGVFSLATDDYLHVWRNGDSRGMQSAFCGFLIR